MSVLVTIRASFILDDAEPILVASTPSNPFFTQLGASLTLQALTWDHFSGPVNLQMPWSAHIYWNIEYQIIDPKKKTVAVQILVSPKSWVKDEKKCAHLLNHEQGHYLIGAMCALEFMRRLQTKPEVNASNIQEKARETYNRTMLEYLEMEKKYDNETQHRLNYKRQAAWDHLIFERLTYFKKVYDVKKNRFVKIKKKL